MSEEYCDPESLLPSQFADLFRAQPEWSGEQRLCAHAITLAARDWERLQKSGRVGFDPRSEFTIEDARDLDDWLFSDAYGAGDPLLLSFRTCCRAVGLEVDAVRKRLLSFGTKDDLEMLGLPTNSDIYKKVEVTRARYTHCRNGHLYSAENTTVLPNGTRKCLECKRNGRTRARLKKSVVDTTTAQEAA